MSLLGSMLSSLGTAQWVLKILLEVYGPCVFLLYWVPICKWARWIYLCDTFGYSVLRTPWFWLGASCGLLRHGVVWCWHCINSGSQNQGFSPPYSRRVSHLSSSSLSNPFPPYISSLGWSGTFVPPVSFIRWQFPGYPCTGLADVTGGRLDPQLA